MSAGSYVNLSGQEIQVSHLSEYMGPDGTWDTAGGRLRVTRDIVIGEIDYSGVNDTTSILRVTCMLEKLGETIQTTSIMDWDEGAGRHVVRSTGGVDAVLHNLQRSDDALAALGDWDPFDVRLRDPTWVTSDADLEITDYSATYQRTLSAEVHPEDVASYNAIPAFSHTGGEMPPGWSVFPDGVLAGTVAGSAYPAGTYTFTITAFSRGDNAGSGGRPKVFTVSIAATDPAVFTTTSASFSSILAGSGSTVVRASGDNVVVDLVGSGDAVPVGVTGYDLPAELSWDDTSDTLSGNMSGRSFLLTFRATSKVPSKDAMVTYMTYVLGTSTELPGTDSSTNYTASLREDGGTAKFALEAGSSLPDGATLDEAGTLSGTFAAGTVSFATVQSSYRGGFVASVSRTYTLEVVNLAFKSPTFYMKNYSTNQRTLSTPVAPTNLMMTTIPGQTYVGAYTQLLIPSLVGTTFTENAFLTLEYTLSHQARNYQEIGMSLDSARNTTAQDRTWRFILASYNLQNMVFYYGGGAGNYQFISPNGSTAKSIFPGKHRLVVHWKPMRFVYSFQAPGETSFTVYADVVPRGDVWFTEGPVSSPSVMDVGGQFNDQAAVMTIDKFEIEDALPLPTVKTLYHEIGITESWTPNWQSYWSMTSVANERHDAGAGGNNTNNFTFTLPISETPGTRITVRCDVSSVSTMDNEWVYVHVNGLNVLDVLCGNNVTSSHTARNGTEAYLYGTNKVIMVYTYQVASENTLQVTFSSSKDQADSDERFSIGGVVVTARPYD